MNKSHGRGGQHDPRRWRARRAAGASNVIVIIADDMGYSDISPFGGEIPTPTCRRWPSRECA
nr:Arylsulfatase precursor [Klebsiella pneumoniae]